MRVMIELDIPDGQDIPTVEDIKRLTDPNWLSEWWHIDDVKSLDETLTDEEAQEVLRIVGRIYDCNIGINWDFLAYWVNHVIEERKDDSN